MNGTRNQKNHKKTVDLVFLSIFVAIELVLAITSLGYINIGFMWATTMQIPVILGGMLLGIKSGAFLGLVFGMTSMVTATVIPTVTSFVFTPFYPVPGTASTTGSPWSLVVCFVPRILVGVLCGWLGENWVKKPGKSRFSEGLRLAITGFAGSFLNTLLVITGILVFFGPAYEVAVPELGGKLIVYLLGTVVAVNGVVEGLIAAVVTLLVGKVLLQIKRKA